MSYLISTPDANCGNCGQKLTIGSRVWYAGDLLDNANRRCEDCTDLDLFGGAA